MIYDLDNNQLVCDSHMNCMLKDDLLSDLKNMPEISDLGEPDLPHTAITMIEQDEAHLRENSGEIAFQKLRIAQEKVEDAADEGLAHAEDNQLAAM